MRAHLQLPLEGVIEPLPPIDGQGGRHPRAWAAINTALCLTLMGVAVALWRFMPIVGWTFAALIAILEATRAIFAFAGAYRPNYPVRGRDARLAGLSCALAALAMISAPLIASIIWA